MTTFKIVTAFILGIVLAECESLALPVVLVSGSFLGWLFLRKHSEKMLLVGIVAAGCLLALQDKVEVAVRTTEKTESRRLDFLADRLDSLSISHQARGLAYGILMGKKDFLSRQQTQSLRNAGMSHIVAVSGLHVGIIYALLLVLLLPLRLFRNRMFRCLQSVVGVVCIWLYVIAIGCPVSGIRAALMISIHEYNFLAERYNERMVILASSALLMLLFDTQLLWDVGFQLSFLATFGILKSINRQKKESRLFHLVRMSFFAQVMTAPVVAYYFHAVPILGWVQGILVVPLLPVLVYATLLYAALPMFSCLAWPVETLSSWIFFISDKVAALESWCLGGKLLWYPNIVEACALELFCIALCLVLSPQRTQHPARRKNILPL